MARLLRIGTRRPWAELRVELADALARELPGAPIEVHDEPSIAWHDGPAEATVAAAVGVVPGWRLVMALSHPLDPDGGHDDRRSPIWLRRTFSDEALALAVVRYQASTVRPYDSERPGAELKLRDVLDVDDPASSGFALADAMAALLLAAPPDPDDDQPTRADAWSRRLTELGYDRLWNQAYAEAAL
jgi:hypothetical protein